jgi:hypothetical protein
MEKFPIVIKSGSQKFHLLCELVDRDKDFETFKIYPENKPQKHIIVQGNRPMLRRKGLKHKAIKWAVSEETKYQSNVDQALRQIEQYLEPAYKIISKASEPITKITKSRKDKPSSPIVLGDRINRID